MVGDTFDNETTFHVHNQHVHGSKTHPWVV